MRVDVVMDRDGQSNCELFQFISVADPENPWGDGNHGRETVLEAYSG